MFWTGRSRRHEKPAAKGRRLTFALAALLAVFLQAFVVQTHVHAPFAPLNLAYAQPADSTQDGSVHASATDEHRLVCAICHALTSSSTLLPHHAAIAVTADRSNTLAIVALALAPTAISFIWQSRAPPSAL